MLQIIKFFFYLRRVLNGSQTPSSHLRKLRLVSRRVFAKQFSLNSWKTTESANFLLLVHIPKVVLHTHTKSYWRSYHSYCVITDLFLVCKLSPQRRHIIQKLRTVKECKAKRFNIFLISLINYSLTNKYRKLSV